MDIWVQKYFIRDNDIYRFLNRDCTVNEINTGHIHPTIDILCDTYKYVTKDYKFIELAIKIIERVLDDYRWENGLIPTIPDKNFNSLDIQTDFIASCWRISEITGDKHKNISYQIYNSVLKYHG